MWCLERLRLGPECLRRSGDWLLSGRARRAKSRTTAACANVLTPDRIPEFCIPPRLVPRLALAAFRNSWVEEAEMDEGAGRTDWDPRSQAALSLPHLPPLWWGAAARPPLTRTSASTASRRTRCAAWLFASRPGTRAAAGSGAACWARVSCPWAPSCCSEGPALLRPPGTARRQCSIVVGRSRKASFDQDFCFDGLSEDEVRRLAVRVKAWEEGRGRERGRLLGQGELSLGALLLL
ncbi:PREDICTED: C2 calcium-dependent domain-containing protein 4A [Colobus angolensis palliatus]|uniref:C2 calcium-dependent domain-containing protein 4A n=1 Tax=Colobus angolensis palliatus TaxID=336983 RepID=UPI0005F50DFC|nr:PREDICTED: C2 calcium-dependent domain-containing protein 4A [Colobus angolensis palliatus]